jgi:NAD(P)H-quinone oxidoreductase subunit 5
MLLFAHAVSKALMFMSVGAIITTTQNQDLTEMGGLWSRMPVTTTAFVVASAGLIGILPLGGFWALRLGMDDFWTDEPWLVGVVLVVNALSALNLTRVFRLVFLGAPQPKTRRAPEVGWAMAVPMVSLTIVTLLTPLMMQRLSVLPDWEYFNHTAAFLLVLSGVVGCGVGATVYLHKAWSRSVHLPWRVLQDLLSYDFYIERLYEISLVNGVVLLARFSNWCDRYIVDGMVNFLGIASIFSGESLKYSITGQSQAYLLTMLVAVSLLGGVLIWFAW